MEENVDRLANKVAIITGGAGGIGAAAGLLFCEEGAQVALVDSDGDAMEATLADIRARLPGARVDGIIADVPREKAAAEAVGKARDAHGPIDVLVNLAGIRAYEPLGESKAETWDRILDVNFLSYVWFIKAAIADLRASGRGSVVNVSSTHGVNPRGGTGQYDATKAAIISMTKTLAFEEAGHGVRANAVCPGLTITPFHRRRFAAAGRTEEDILQQGRDGCLLGRWAEPREAAYPILWLASEEASYVTGSVLMVDGGRFVKHGL
jgi:NAD(P)-dependent dehydrogenase (short-subunit alcohol dehydrogenase family)